MDPVSIIVAALVAGAAAAGKETVEQGIKDAYAGLKQVITDRYAAWSGAEKESPEALEARLREAGAGEDDELRREAESLLARIKEQDPASLATVRARRVTGETVAISDFKVHEGGRLDFDSVEARGDVRISGFEVGDSPF